MCLVRGTLTGVDCRITEHVCRVRPGCGPLSLECRICRNIIEQTGLIPGREVVAACYWRLIWPRGTRHKALPSRRSKGSIRLLLLRCRARHCPRLGPRRVLRVRRLRSWCAGCGRRRSCPSLGLGSHVFPCLVSGVGVLPCRLGRGRYAKARVSLRSRGRLAIHRRPLRRRRELRRHVLPWVSLDARGARVTRPAVGVILGLLVWARQDFVCRLDSLESRVHFGFATRIAVGMIFES